MSRTDCTEPQCLYIQGCTFPFTLSILATTQTPSVSATACLYFTQPQHSHLPEIDKVLHLSSFITHNNFTTTDFYNETFNLSTFHQSFFSAPFHLSDCTISISFYLLTMFFFVQLKITLNMKNVLKVSGY